MKNIDEAARRIVEGRVGDPNVAVDGLNAVRRKVLRDGGIVKRFHESKCTVEHIDPPVLAIIGGI